jgi:hypothetical protein
MNITEINQEIARWTKKASEANNEYVKNTSLEIAKCYRELREDGDEVKFLFKLDLLQKDTDTVAAAMDRITQYPKQDRLPCDKEPDITKKRTVDDIIAAWKKRCSESVEAKSRRDKLKIYTPIPRFSGRPKRDTVISKEEIDSLIIDVNVLSSDQFIDKIEEEL